MSDPQGTTHPVRLTVAAEVGGEKNWQVYAELHLPAGPPPSTVQLLLSGLTYDSRYWNLPGENDYVAHATRAGHAVLALDRIGTGRSSHPPAAEVTVASNVAVVHQVVEALRSGRVAGHSFGRIVAVGHSLGTGIALIEAARHRDLDAVVATGLLHNLGPGYEQALPALYPAALDPLLAGENLPDGYLTTQPGRRADLYEHPGAVTAELSKWHEETKSTVTLGEGGTLAEIYAPEVAREVGVPVLLVVGAEDQLFVGGAVTGETEAVRAYESNFYGPDAALEVFVLPAAGHGLNAHRNAPEWFAAAQSWIARALA